MNPRLLLISGLAALLLVSSVTLVYVQHVRRELFMELKGLEAERDRMQVEWGQFQLEASTWAAQDRIEQLAVDKLGFRVPSPASVVVVKR
jgi:cell division protein FtsL